MSRIAAIALLLAVALLNSCVAVAPAPAPVRLHAALAEHSSRHDTIALRGQRSNASEAINSTQAVAATAAAAPAAATASSPAAAGPAGAPGAANTGHCGCVKDDAAACTCGGHLEYLECVARACFTGKCSGGCPALMDSFMGQCELVSNESPCGAELSMGCTGKEASCEGRFHQERNGVIGLEVDTEHLSDEAYCGPWGKCQGELRVVVDVHNPEPGLTVECALPKVEDAEFHDREKWYTCSGEITGSRGGCTLPMVEELAPEAKLDGRCWLQKAGDKVTKRAYFNVENHYNRDLEQAKRSQTEAKDPKEVLPSPAKSQAAGTVAQKWLAPLVVVMGACARLV